jgi:Rnl2 family RNA ligase
MIKKEIMEFKKYNSIENTYRKEVLEQIIIHGFENETYIVQEKVHGANFSFFTNGKDIKIAKRTGFIEENETFYNAQLLAEKYQNKVIAIFNDLKSTIPNLEFITIFGELFGGNYNHNAITKDINAIKVQKGIEYAPFNDFYAFDIKWNNYRFLDVEDANALFEKHHFFYAKTLFKGSLKEALDYPNTFNSFIPEWLGLPTLENNITEGVIIKPNKPLYFKNESRLILKNKNEKWSEKEKVKKVKNENAATVFTSEGSLIWNIIQTYANTNRLYNVLSKEGEFHPKMMGKLIGLFSIDVQADFAKDHPDLLSTLEKAEQRLIFKELNAKIIQLIKEEFIKFK